MHRTGTKTVRVLTLFAALVVAVSLPAQGANEAALRDLDVIWGAVWDEYADPFFNGVDWHRLPDEVRPRIEAAPTLAEAYQALADMVARLGDPSTYLVEPDPYYTFYETEYAGIGVLIGAASSLNEISGGVQFADDEVAVLEVFEGTPAEAAGVLVGDVIVAVDGWNAIGATTDEISGRIRGEVGSQVQLTLRAPDGTERTLTITRERVDLRPTVTFRRINDRLAYLRLDTLLAEQVLEAREFLLANADVDHLILDLRGVSSGEPNAMGTVAGWFLGEVDLGAFESRYDRYTLKIPASDVSLPIYHGELTVLVHGGTSGLGEVLALLLAEYGRATVVGLPTAGGFSLTRLVILPSGWGLSLSIARYVSPQGRGVHAEGLTPHVPLDQVTLTDLRAERDPLLNRAIEWVLAKMGA